MSRKHKRPIPQDPCWIEVEHCIWPQCSDAVLLDADFGLPFCTLHLGHVQERVADKRVIHDRRDSEAWQLRAQAEREKEDRAKAARESKGMQPGFIYYIDVDSHVKIGYAVDVKKRMRAYPPHAKLLAVHPGTLDLEKTIHRQFAHSLVAGREWFAPDATLRDHVAKVREQFGDPKDHAHHHRKRSRSGGPSVSSFGVKW